MDEKIKQLSESYLGINVEQEKIDRSFLEIVDRLPPRDLPVNRIRRRYYLFASLVIIIFGIISTTLVFSGSAKPGEVLYSIKTISDGVMNGILRKQEIQTGDHPDDIDLPVNITSKPLKKDNSTGMTSSGSAELNNGYLLFQETEKGQNISGPLNIEQQANKSSDKHTVAPVSSHPGVAIKEVHTASSSAEAEHDLKNDENNGKSKKSR